MTSHKWSQIQPAQKRTAFYLSLSFLIPYLIMTSAFIVQGVHPFGSHMILTVDLYHQYAPFVAELRDKILHGKSLWYSWNIGLGTNFWAIFANYAASPLNFLILYFPVSYMSVFRRASLKNAWSSIWRFAVYSVIAGGMSAILVYPTWIALKQSSATGDSFPKDYTLTQNVFDFLGRFFLTSKPNIRDGMANVYCGVLILMFIPLYFLCSRIRLREKIG